jgi:hypothetical protein
MSANQWAPGTLYQPGAIVTPRTTTGIVTQVQPSNNSFESGTTDWTAAVSSGSGTVTQSAAEAFDGAYSALFTASAGSGDRNSAFVTLINNYMAPVQPGQVINFQGYVYRNWTNANTAYVTGGARIYWYDSSHTLIKYDIATQPAATLGAAQSAPAGMVGTRAAGIWQVTSGTATAPANAAYASAAFAGWVDSNGGSALYFDDYTWDYTEQGYPPGLTFVATQNAPGISGATEPVWPVNAGQTVQDGGVTWTAEDASLIIWTATSILKSGATQPNFPTTVGGSVVDGTVVWTASDGRVTDTNCPQSTVVAIGEAKVYAADGDIIRFCATTNPLDWSSSQDAGFIPFGLNTYGNEPCLALGLYRSNLLAFNTLGYQMWQIDPDPNNIAILDAEPVGSAYNKAGQPVNNDFVFLSPVGIRNIGTAGASGNLQAGSFGKQVDPLVQAFVRTYITNQGYEPRGLYNPATGQYWLILGTQVIVLTINGTSAMSWSRYTFPDAITDWTVGNGTLYLRAGDLVWELDTTSTIFTDDTQISSSVGGTNTGYHGYVAWNYVEGGQLGIDKIMEGFDLTIGQIDDEGQVVYNNDLVCNVSFGYNQSNPALSTTPFAITGDTIPGTMVPHPMIAPSFQLRLDFGTGQNWGWGAANLYISPLLKP